MPKSIHPIALYLLSLAATVTAYGFYASFAVPAIEGEAIVLTDRAVDPSDYPQTIHSKEEFAFLFQPGDWELDSCKTLQTNEGKVLFQDYQPTDDGFVDVFPFTIVLDAKQPGDPPLVLRCMRGARLQLDRPFALGSSEKKNQKRGSGRMERASLLGEVKIFRHRTSPDKDDSLEILTSNVQIEKQQVFTLETVRFKLGPNLGHGSNMRIDMVQENPGNSITNDFSKIKGIRKIQLARLDLLKITPPAKQPLNPNGNRGKLLSGQNQPIEVRCEGEFVFDLKDQSATFRKNVSVRQLDEYGDSLSCQQLQLFFTGADLQAVDPTDPVAERKISLRRILAVGNPVVLNAASRKARVRGQQLEYDITKNQVSAFNQSGSVSITNAEFQFDAKSLLYKIPTDQSLGDLDALGPGQMIRMGTRDKKEFRATWKKQLSIRTQGDKKLVTLDGQTKLSLGDDTNISAKQLRLWLWQVAGNKRENEQRLDAQITGGGNWSYLPAQLKTAGDVIIQSPRLNGRTDSLSATWPTPQTTDRQAQQFIDWPRVVNRRPTYQNQQRPDRHANAERRFAPLTQLSRQPMQGRTPRGQVIRDPNVVQASFKEPASQFQFRGDRVHVQLSDHTRDATITELKIKGKVLIEEVVGQSQLADEQPLKISGQELQMTPQGNEAYRMFVVGSEQQPAAVRAKGLFLKGTNVHLDQSANKLWVEGIGMMELSPTQDKNVANDATGLAGENVKVQWTNGMIFDGRRIYFERDVQFQTQRSGKTSFVESNDVPNSTSQFSGANNDGSRSLISTRSEGLSITLNQRLNLKQGSGLHGGVSKPEIEEIVLVSQLDPQKRVFQLASYQNRQANPVVIENSTLNLQGEITEKQRFVVPSANIRTDSGKIGTRGPGSISIYRQGKSGFGGSNSSSSSGPQTITYTQVKFDGSLSADSGAKDILIRGNVRVLHQPVSDWNTILDADTVANLPPEGIKLKCDQIQLQRWMPRGTETPQNELIATGNAHVVGQSFEATADRVSYSQKNDLMVIEGSPRSYANLRYQKGPRGRPNQLTAGKISYRLSDQWTEVVRIKNASTNVEGPMFGGQRR